MNLSLVFNFALRQIITHLMQRGLLTGVGDGTTRSIISHLPILWLCKVPRSCESTTRLIKGSLTVDLLVEGSGLFFWGRNRIPCCASLVPPCLFKYKPDVSSPQDEVQIAENLRINERERAATRTLKSYCSSACLTTDVFRPDHLGPYTELHLLACTLQADKSRTTSSGSVAAFTSDRPLAQADELTSHMNENTTVTMKSCGAQNEQRVTKILSNTMEVHNKCRL